MLLAGYSPMTSVPAVVPRAKLRDLFPGKTVAVDLTGERSGKLVAEARIEGHGSGRGVLWLCRCDCGRPREVETRHFHDRTACEHDDCLAGRTFGRLTVQRLASETCIGTAWWCLCACGATCRVTASRLLAGTVRSCGSPACRVAVRGSRTASILSAIDARYWVRELLDRVARDHGATVAAVLTSKPSHVRAWDARRDFYRKLKCQYRWRVETIAKLVGVRPERVRRTIEAAPAPREVAA